MENRSIPPVTVIPVLQYPSVGEAVEWLCRAFGLRERLRIGDHRAQLSCGDGAVVVAEGLVGAGGQGFSLMVRVPDAAAHCAHAEAEGATILARPEDHPYGERQYTAADLAGHRWTFTQSIADVDPRDWGGELRDEQTPSPHREED